jgi:transposase-like protein
MYSVINLRKKFYVTGRDALPSPPADWSNEMSVSASEIEKAESRAKANPPKQYTEEYRLEAVEYYRKAREADPKKSIRECAAELGINDKTLNDWVIKYGGPEGSPRPGPTSRGSSTRHAGASGSSRARTSS